MHVSSMQQLYNHYIIYCLITVSAKNLMSRESDLIAAIVSSIILFTAIFFIFGFVLGFVLGYFFGQLWQKREQLTETSVSKDVHLQLSQQVEHASLQLSLLSKT